MLEFFKEIISSVRATSLDRIKNPFIGAFCFSWITFNFKSILVLFFSHVTIEERLIWIDSHNNIYNYTLYPLLLSLIILCFLPLISAAIMRIQDLPLSYVMQQYGKRDAATFTRKIETEKLRAQASVMFKRVVADEELVIQNLNSEIEKSKDESRKLQEEIAKLISERNLMTSELASTQALINAGNENSVLLISTSLDLNNAKNELLEKNKIVADLSSELAKIKEMMVDSQKKLDVQDFYLDNLLIKYPELFSEVTNNQ